MANMKFINPVVLLAALAGVCGCSPVWAACVEESKEAKATGTMSEAVYHGVDEATKLMAKNQHAEAIEKLTKLVEGGGDFDKAVVYYNLGFAYSSKNDYANAAKSFAKALALKALPAQQQEQLQYNLGQLYIVAGQHEEGIKVLQEYVANACKAVPAEAHIFLANALVERKRFAEAVPQIDLAISKAKAPNQSWYEMKLAVNYEQKDFKACAQTLVQLIGLAPTKPEYWKQLSSMFFEMKSDMDAVAVLSVADRQGFIEKPNERQNLFNVYMGLDLPFKAGLMMQESIDKGKVPADEATLGSVADAWINAREAARAETTLKKLASMSEKGEYFFKLGAMYGDNEQWKDSREALQKAVQKGGLKRAGEAWMRLAVAEYSLKNNDGAIAALQKAITFDETRKQAGEWLRHLSGQTTATARST
ncbi:MAG TPA: tetratricopeptide repeat protein [Steroidobacteraceae bacterium]|jgi:tetratricopeptide (TPR) repeat protein|nr:tetratricopeptide repeat protein [Steroidobacteraceae bacterium]